MVECCSHGEGYCNDPMFSDRHVWTNSVDPDLIRVYTVCHSVCMFWTPYSMLKPNCSNLRIITVNYSGFSGVRIFRI